MANVYIPESVYVHESNIELDGGEEDIVDLMKKNSIDVVEVLALLNWELPDFQEAARQLDIEYIPFTTTGAGLLHIFKKMETTEQREFLSMITDSIISYYRSDLTLQLPNELR
jgi:hypothetical protein